MVRYDRYASIVLSAINLQSARRQAILLAESQAGIMGADLYIKKLHAKGTNNLHGSKAHFRDSYNMSNVLWTLNLSWWKDVLPHLDKKLELKGENLRRFRGQVGAAKQRLPTSRELRGNRVVMSKSGENSIENWQRHYVKKREELMAFLDRAIENRSSIICSL